MERKLVLSLPAVAGAIGLLVPAASSAQVEPACVVVDDPANFHLQLEYAPNGQSDCTNLP